MHASTNIIQQYDPILLDEMNHVKLLSRSDTKMAFSLASLPAFLQLLQPHYRILEVDGIRGINYESLYFDTDGFLFYNQNHSGLANRYKVRYRKYMNSGLTFLEVKHKYNNQRTVKERIEKEVIETEFDDESQKFLSQIVPVASPQDLIPKLWIYYTRFTLVHRSRKERLTIDVNLRFKSYGDASSSETISDQLVIAELKQENFSCNSDFIQLMREHRISEISFSKYCMASLTLFDHLKHNLFKPKLLTLKKICNGNNYEYN